VAAEHNAETQTCDAGLQMPLGQSAVELHPHAPARQSAPIELPAQLAHAPPVAPQAAVELPEMQDPASQQPPLHGEAALQAAPHTWTDASQAIPAGQSAAELQPQPPATQACPAAAPVQSVQAPAPHAFAAVPDTH
jgi:hypothetical protein